jgi:alpha-ketoglutarate-dependent taurine dioxygenase
MQELAQKVQETGFALLEGYQSERSAAEVVSLLGEADTLGAQGPVHQLKPGLAEARPSNTYSGIYGLGTFPLHTDMAHWHVPPRFLMLRCLQGSAAVPTTLVDGLQIIEQVGETALTRALVKPRRAVQGKRLLLRLYERDHAGGYLLRWDEKYILAASPAGERGMSQLRAALATVPPLDVHLIRPGDTLLLDNWRMLHGRGSVPPDALNRTIARAYLRSIH